MTARAIYKGLLLLDGEQVRVKFYSAAEDRSIHFRLLHASDGVPLKQRMIDPSSKNAVPRAAIRRGYETDDGHFVVVTREEQERLSPPASREIRVLRFVPESALGHQFYVRPYYLGPDGASDAYFALARVLSKGRLVGIVQWCMRKKEYLGALFAHEGYLALSTLRHIGEVVDASRLPKPEGKKLSAQERKVASQLVEMLSGDFDATAYTDEYRGRLEEFLEKKARGLPTKLGRVTATREEPDSLLEALQSSLTPRATPRKATSKGQRRTAKKTAKKTQKERKVA